MEFNRRQLVVVENKLIYRYGPLRSNKSRNGQTVEGLVALSEAHVPFETRRLASSGVQPAHGHVEETECQQ